MTNELAYFWLLILVALVTSLVGGLIVRRRYRPLTMRRIKGYETMPLLIDEAIESARQTNISIAGVEIGQTTTLFSLAAMSLLYELSRRQAFTEDTPLVTVSDGIVLAAALDMIRKTFAAEDNLAVYEAGTAVWMPTGERSLAFGAGVAALNGIRNVSSNIMVGAYGSEMALVGDAAIRRDAFFIGQSTQPIGQAIGFVYSSEPIIGEELFASEAYLYPDDQRLQTRLVVLDVLRWVIVAAILLIAILNIN